MEIKTLIKQNIEMLFKETFNDVILQFPDKIYICGRKMYIRLNNIIVSIEFQGTELAYNTVILTASSIYGVIDQNITPMCMLFKESKLRSGEKKIINLKIALGETGEYTVVWSGELSDSDKMNLNNFVINYIELFCNLSIPEKKPIL